MLRGIDGNIQLVSYIDANFARELTGRKSHYSYVFYFIGGVIIHQSKRQLIIAMSSTHSEYVALFKIA
jgi:hypothetical protein